MPVNIAAVEVIAPNLKRRLSGVTATIVRLVPVQSRSIGIAATGPGLPASLPRIPLARLPFLPRDRWRVWHARRNTEMLLGLALRHLFRRKLKLLFTSASQRRHTGYTRWLIGRMDAVIATSQRSAGYLERPSTVILHGIDTGSFTPAPDRAALRSRLGLPDALLIGCFGRIRPSKGTDLFVEAMLEVLPRHPGVVALVMGRATDKFTSFLDELKRRTAEAGLTDRLLFLPEVPVDSMADWYRVLDLYIAPQRWEGFGLTPLEAMACGVPVVATRVGAFEELVTEETGALVPPGEAMALAAAAERVIASPSLRNDLREAARARVLTGFRIEDEANALIDVYRRLLA